MQFFKFQLVFQSSGSQTYFISLEMAYCLIFHCVVGDYAFNNALQIAVVLVVELAYAKQKLKPIIISVVF